MKNRIFLSPPHMGGEEEHFVAEAFATNWIAPVGPQLTAFETEFAREVGAEYAVAVSSGTAALHLALRYAGVGPGDQVLCSTLTFVASANPILYLGAEPVFIDSERESWNMDPDLLEKALKKKAAENALPKAVVVVHLYGQSADMERIIPLCKNYGVTVVEDAAEALGARYQDRSPGLFGQSGIFSFNGNKIITTSGGGMIVSNDRALIEKVGFWATQAKEEAPYYEHKEMGYNYRMSGVAAAIGRGQIRVLRERVKTKRRIFARYQEALTALPGITCMPEAEKCHSTRWLTCITVDAQKFGSDCDSIRIRLEEENIESRPLWKPMHLQPLFSGYESWGGQVSEELFAQGLCLPSGSALTEAEQDRVIELIQDCCSGS